jgi:hypothetical protein
MYHKKNCASSWLPARIRQSVRNDLRMENGHDIWNLECEESVGQGY